MPGPSQLDIIIPPEIKGDPFYHAIQQLAQDPRVKTILEIGASSGEGSTEALVRGMLANPSQPTLFTIEVSKVRFAALQQRYAAFPQVRCFNVSSVPASAFPGEAEVTAFYHGNQSALRNVPLERVISWLRQDLAYIETSGLPDRGIELIQRQNHLVGFDLVLIDGSEFSGRSELELTYGARYILLDDILGFKNWDNFHRLKQDPNYRLIGGDTRLRNGFAVFHRSEDIDESVRPSPRRVSRNLTHYREIATQVQSVPGLLVDGQEQYLFDRVQSLPEDAVIVEVGAFKGRSTAAMAFACVGTQRRIYSIDTWDGNDVDFPERDFFSTWQDNLARLGLQEYVTPLRGQSHEMLSRWNELAGRPIDFIFLDGSHDYQDVLRDFQISLPLVKIGGWIAFHDVIHTWPGPWRLWRDYAAHCLDDVHYNTTLACGRKNESTEQRLQEMLATPIDPLPIHFFTIVLNGEPFIRHHIEQFKQLPFRWHWHIMEGVAHLRHDTAWSLPSGGKIPDQFHHKGLSNDGTTQYLDELVKAFPQNVTVYRKKEGFWDGKREMVSAPLMHILEECLLWEVDVDEIWRAQQIVDARKMFLGNRDRTSAFYLCLYLIGPDRLIVSRDGYGNHYGGEWLRTWRFRPGMVWARHEPPILAEPIGNNQYHDVGRVNPFTRDETERAGLVFEHYAYATLPQVLFKQSYYGYSGAVAGWLALQEEQHLPRRVGDFLPWVQDQAMVDSARAVIPAHTFAFPDLDAGKEDKASVRNLIYVRTDAIGDAILSSPTLECLSKAYFNARITVICQERVAPIYEKCPHVHQIIAFDGQQLRHPEYCTALWQRLRTVKADLCISGLQSRTNATDFFVAISGAKERIGLHGDLANIESPLRDEGDLSYTRFIASPDPIKNEISRQKDILHGLGIELPLPATKMWTAPEDERAAEAIFAEHQLDPARTIAMWSGAQSRVRDAEQIGLALQEFCQRNGFRVIALGGDQNQDINRSNLSAIPNDPVDLTGKTSIRVAAEIIRRCRLAVGVDTSLGHVACAVGTPNVILLGGGHFGRFMPYSPLTTVVCLPIHCYGCRWVCRYERPHCVRDVEPRVITAAIENALERSSSKPRIFAQDRSLWQAGPNRPSWAWFHQYVNRKDVEVIAVGVHPDGSTRLTPLDFPERHRALAATDPKQAHRREIAFALLQTPLPDLPQFFTQRVATLLEQDPASLPAAEPEAIILDELLAGLARGPNDSFSLYYQILCMLYLYRSELPDGCLTDPPAWLKIAIPAPSAASGA